MFRDIALVGGPILHCTAVENKYVNCRLSSEQPSPTHCLSHNRVIVVSVGQNVILTGNKILFKNPKEMLVKTCRNI